MCFYFGIKDPVKKIEKRFNKPFENSSLFTPDEKYNGFAHPICAIISNDKTNVISVAKWGLLPSWSKDEKFAKNTLNARIETIESLPSFKDYNNNRCLIPANYFYEWRHEGKNKIPYKIYSQENEIFCFGGIYSDWKNPTNKIITRTFSIITTEANQLMKYIHNEKMRMPVILNKEDELNWLNNTSVEKFAFPYSANLLGMENKK